MSGACSKGVVEEERMGRRLDVETVSEEDDGGVTSFLGVWFCVMHSHGVEAMRVVPQKSASKNPSRQGGIHIFGACDNADVCREYLPQGPAGAWRRI